MFQYHCLNPIAEKGLKLFGDNYKKTETADQCDAILVRSAKMHDMELPKSVCAVARAGAGVNNIPVKEYAEMRCCIQHTWSQRKRRKRAGTCRYAPCIQRYRRRYRVGCTGER